MTVVADVMAMRCRTQGAADMGHIWATEDEQRAQHVPAQVSF